MINITTAYILYIDECNLRLIESGPISHSLREYLPPHYQLAAMPFAFLLYASFILYFQANSMILVVLPLADVAVAIGVDLPTKAVPLL